MLDTFLNSLVCNDVRRGIPCFCDDPAQNKWWSWFTCSTLHSHLTSIGKPWGWAQQYLEQGRILDTADVALVQQNQDELHVALKNNRQTIVIGV
jgi:hypothetical protein